ncbi:hypothetical protein Goshw_030506 [Gossypium schwendimanii]|uniref:Uncharacterized protein n=1 Tax=Gossypium schwendimanii TaxID=34291 RepID=A0A7J9MYJ4_GOSSC|nr:hypothetical protein [Gossypium schwendimanii]
MEPSLNIVLIRAGETEKPEENVTYMDAYVAAEGKIEEFNNHPELQLESLKTKNHDNVLHVNFSTPEYYAEFYVGILSSRYLPLFYLFFHSFLWISINKRNTKKQRSCPSHAVAAEVQAAVSFCYFQIDVL